MDAIFLPIFSIIIIRIAYEVFFLKVQVNFCPVGDDGNKFYGHFQCFSFSSPKYLPCIVCKTFLIFSFSGTPGLCLWVDIDSYVEIRFLPCEKRQNFSFLLVSIIHNLSVSLQA